MSHWTQTDAGKEKARATQQAIWASYTPEQKAAKLAALNAGKKRAARLKKMALWRRKNGKVTGAHTTKYSGLKVKRTKTKPEASEGGTETTTQTALPPAITAAVVRITSVINDPNSGRAVMEAWSTPADRLLDTIAELIHNGNVWYEIRIESERS